MCYIQFYIIVISTEIENSRCISFLFIVIDLSAHLQYLHGPAGGLNFGNNWSDTY